MRILFSVNNFGFLRNFEPALRLLAARGHHLHLVAERKDSVGGTRTIEHLERDYPDRVTYAYAPSRKDAPWQALAMYVRLCLDYWRYLDRRYERSPSLRERAAQQAPPFASRLPRWPIVGSRPAMRGWRALFGAIERAVPVPDPTLRWVREQRPDLLLLTPLLYFGSQQVEYVRAARALGIRSVLGVGSWDHLTTKGLIHELPDRVVVWNEFQKQEAAELHGVPPERVTVTGAQSYDHWFAAAPRTSREEFGARVGLPAERPMLLYLCSSPFITPYEVGFVRRWLQALRAHRDPLLRSAAVLIRPHPQNAAQWSDFDAAEFDDVALWPRAGANPIDTETRADYYDSMHHSTAVVGVNTSALIESAIVGRPVYTMLAPEFAGQQEGTLHFQHLKNANGGLLHVGETLEAHLDQLADAVGRQPDAGRSRAFVEAFVRPHGLEVASAERFVAVMESERALVPPPPVPPSAWTRLLRVLLLPLAALARAAGKRKRQARAAAPAKQPGATSRLLFVLSSPEYLRYYDSTMKELAQRGHQVMVAVNWLRERKHARLDALIDDPRIEILGVVPKRFDLWTPFARAVRGTMDFVRYMDPHFADTPALRDRIRRRALPPLLGPIDRVRTLGGSARGRAIGLLQACERAIPISGRVQSFLETCRPDAVVVSPLVDAASDQVDTVRAAQAAGIPVVAAIASWDNLTNKGHMRVLPDMVTVWNEAQKAEAVTLHGVPPDRVAVTGAQLFDRWFERGPSQSREEFGEMVGLPGRTPFVLFTGSSVFIARSETEVPFVRSWIEALRASSDPLLRNVPVLVRPHPFNCQAWETADFSDLGPVAIWPRQRYTPAAESARTSFFDSLYYSTAVVGINTSAMIEAAILLKPVFSILAPTFAGTQEGTLHFRHLLPENGGFLQVAGSIDAHVQQLAAAVRNPELTREHTRRFVATFLRPRGLLAPCTPILANAIERAAAVSPARLHETAGTRLLRTLLRPLAALVGWLHLGEDLPALVRRAGYEAWGRLGRTTRILLKRLVIRPVRLVLSALALMFRLARRMLRQARYTVAVKARGEAFTGEGSDGRR
jgi:hypothetical protein